MAAVPKIAETYTTPAESAATTEKLGGTAAANAIAQRWSSAYPRLETSVDTPAASRTTWFTSPQLQPNTAHTANRVEVIIEPGNVQRVDVTSKQVRRVDGVVSEIMRDTVVIRCFFGSHSVAINLPPSLIPTELLQFGKPIRLSLDERNGIRTPIVEARPIDAQPDLPEQREIEAWIDNI
jgi:hypothetical protein